MPENRSLTPTTQRTMANASSQAPTMEPSPMYISMPENAHNATNNNTDEVPEQHIILELMAFAKNRPWQKKLLTAVIVLTSFYVLFDLIFLGNVQTFINTFLEWMIDHPAGAIFSFIAFFVLATLCFVPPAILMFGAGYAFSDVLGFGPGVLMGTFVSFVGCCFGAIMAFVRSRYMMRDLVELFSRRYPIVTAMDGAMRRNGFHVMLLLRLCPIIPFNGLNYIGGVTAISLGDYTKALIGVFPTILLWVFIGASADQLSHKQADGDGEQLYMLILISSGIAFGILGVILIWRVAMEELQKEIANNSAESWLRYSKQPVGGDPEHGTVGAAPTTTTANNNDQPMGDQGFEVTDTATLRTHGILAMLGIGDNAGIETHTIPVDDHDLHDEEWFWILT